MIQLFILQGQINPSGAPPSCGLEEKAFIPQLKPKNYIQDIKVLRKVQEDFASGAQDVPFFWKQRLLIQISTAPYILSASFLPTALSQPSILFVQKTHRIKEITGFVAPYLTEEERAMWNGIVSSGCFYSVQNEASLLPTIEGLDGVIYPDIRACLEFFFHDKTTSALSLTFLQPTGDYKTHTWIKS